MVRARLSSIVFGQRREKKQDDEIYNCIRRCFLGPGPRCHQPQVHPHCSIPFPMFRYFSSHEVIVSGLVPLANDRCMASASWSSGDGQGSPSSEFQVPMVVVG